MTVGDTTSGAGEEPGPDSSVHATPHHEVDHTVEPTDDPLAIRLEALILGADRRYTPFQAARTAGVSMDLASRFWRAMGFADIGQAKALTEADVLALRRLAGLVEAGLLSEPMAIQVARSTGQTTARLAEWQIDSFLEGLTEPPEPGMTRTEVTYPLVELLLPELQEFLVYVWRRQLAAATGRVVQAADDEEMVDRRLAVGFADLVGFTRLTRRLEEEELGELVESFETTAADLVAAHGVRLIKTLGDEVLFAADDAGTAAEIALRLIEAMSQDETMPALRVGIAFGTVTTRMGDVFGTTVNLANAAHLDSSEGRRSGRRGVRQGAGPARRGPGVRGAGRRGRRGRRRTGPARREGGPRARRRAAAAHVPLRSPADVAAPGARARRGRAVAAGPPGQDRLLRDVRHPWGLSVTASPCRRPGGPV